MNVYLIKNKDTQLPRRVGRRKVKVFVSKGQAIIQMKEDQYVVEYELVPTGEQWNTFGDGKKYD